MNGYFDLDFATKAQNSLKRARMFRSPLNLSDGLSPSDRLIGLPHVPLSFKLSTILVNDLKTVAVCLEASREALGHSIAPTKKILVDAGTSSLIIYLD